LDFSLLTTIVIIIWQTQFVNTYFNIFKIFRGIFYRPLKILLFF